MIGTIVKNKYQIKKFLAESSLYEIYLAVEAETGTSVALKILTSEMAKSDVRVKTFSDETAIFAKISHPLVAQVLDFDSHEGRPFLVTEYVEGKDLRTWKKEDPSPTGARGECFGNPISFFEVIQIVRQISDVLKYAHEHGVARRNIKPSNIMREKNGKIRVLSFSLPRIKLVGGNLEPEADAGVQSDLFFLGTTLYELLAGESPMRKRGGINELWDNKLKQALRISHQEIAPEEIDRIIDFIERTFTREVKKRFENHQEFLKGLYELGKIAEKSAKAAKPVQPKSFATASEVVDAIHGRMITGAANKSHEPPLAATASGEPATPANGRSPAPNSISGKRSVVTPLSAASSASRVMGSGGGGSRTSGVTATAQAPAPELTEEELPRFGRPILELIKGGRDTARSVIWRYSEDQPLHKNPVIIISSGIFLMMLLVLFW